MTLLTGIGKSKDQQLANIDPDVNSYAYIIPPDDIHRALDNLLSDFYKDIKNAGALAGVDAKSTKSTIDEAFLDEFNQLPSKLSGTFSPIQAKYKGTIVECLMEDYEFAIVTINSLYTLELADFTWNERKDLLKARLREIKPKLFDRLFPEFNNDSQKTNKRRRHRRPKQDSDDTVNKVVNTGRTLEHPQMNISPPASSTQKFPSIEKGIEALLISLEEKITKKFGLGSYQKVSSVFIKAFEKLPAKLEVLVTPVQLTSQESGSSFKDILDQIKDQFGKELSSMSESVRGDLLFNGLKNTYPQYTHLIRKNRLDAQDTVAVWSHKFEEACTSKDSALSLSTLTNWYAAVRESDELNSCKRLWTKFLELAVTVPVREATDPLAIEDEFIRGTFDVAFGIFATENTKDMEFISFILSRVFDKDKLKSMIKYLELLEKYPGLTRHQMFAITFVNAVKELEFDDEGRYVALRVLDKFPVSAVLSLSNNLFYNLFSRCVVRLDEDMTDVDRFVPFLKSMTEKIGKFKDTDIDLYLRLLSGSGNSRFCDLAIDLAIPRLAALQRNKKIAFELNLVKQEFYVLIFTQSLRFCSDEGYNKFKEVAFTKKWIGDLNSYQLSHFSLFISIFTNPVLTPGISDSADSIFLAFKSQLHLALVDGETGESIESMLRSFFLRVTDINQSENLVLLTQRICRIIQFLCTSFKTTYKIPLSQQSHQYLSHNLFWLTLTQLGKAAIESEEHSAKYLSVLFSVIATLTGNRVYSDPNGISLIFPHTIAGFNKAVKYAWNHPEDRAAHIRLSFISSQIIVNYFMNNFFLAAIPQLFDLDAKSEEGIKKTRACISDLETAYHYFLTDQNDRANSVLKHLTLAPEGPENDLPFNGNFAETSCTVNAIWSTPEMSKELRQQAWSTLFNSYIAFADNLCRRFPEPKHQARVLYAEAANKILTKTTRTIDAKMLEDLTKLQTKDQIMGADLIDLYSPLIVYRESVVKMLDTYKGKGNPSTVYDDLPINMSIRLFRNVMLSCEEKIALTHRLIAYAADNLKSYVNDEIRLKKILILLRLANQDGIESSYFTDLDAEVTAENGNTMKVIKNSLSIILESVRTTRTPEVALLAISLINCYMKNAVQETIPMTEISALIKTITSISTVDGKSDIAFAEVHQGLIKFFLERMTEGTIMIPHYAEGDLKEEGKIHSLKDMNFAIGAFTKSLYIVNHNQFKFMLSNVIKAILCFTSNIFIKEKDAETNKKNNELTESLCRFAISCKEFGLANNPTKSEDQKWVDFINNKIENLKNDPETSREKMDALEIMKGIFFRS